jgi:V/A-type H+-transporting ATPase subunit I
MAVLPMKRVFITALRKDRKAILETMQRLGTVQLTKPTLKELTGSGEDDGVFKKLDTVSAKTTFEKNASLAESALEILDQTVPPKGDGLLGMFNGRTQLSVDQYREMAGKRDKIMDMVYKLCSLSKQKAEAEGEIPKLLTEAEQLKPWLSFDLPLNFKGTKNTVAFIGSLPDMYTLDSLYKAFGEKAPTAKAVDISIISADDTQTCICVIAHKNDAEKTEEGLRSLGFARPSLPGVVPTEELSIIDKNLAEAKGRISSLTAEITKFADKREDIRFIIDYFTMRADKYGVIADLYESKRVFFVTGYIAERDTARLDSEITGKYDCVVEYSDPAPDERVPVVLSNNPYSAPVQGVVENYALPGPGEIDPTFLASIFYYCLFGMMLGDAGYGLLITLGTLFILIKCKNTMEDSMKKTMQLFFGCGVSTTFWGIMFGSFFGNAVATVATTFFGSSLAFKPVWFDPTTEPIKMLGFSFIIGILHLFTGLGAKGYTCIRQGRIKDFLYDVVFWFLFVGSLLVVLVSTDMIKSMFSLDLTIPAPVVSISTWIAIASGVGILLTGGRESRNPVKRLMKGAYAVYGISSWLSDLLSYSRLLALGLATGIIASVFNQLGSMGGNSPLGAIMFILVFLVGQVLNLFINALGAYVHTNRLEYVEFFGKFYDGGGLEFHPFKENTKYYRVK